MRCDIHSFDRIAQEHQQLSVGDLVRMGPGWLRLLPGAASQCADRARPDWRRPTTAAPARDRRSRLLQRDLRL